MDSGETAGREPGVAEQRAKKAAALSRRPSVAVSPGLEEELGRNLQLPGAIE
jgi:hypothetical protein